ncbi:MAG: hypothetical protein ABEJ62_00695, partial [Candidatus Nanohaloarchaea archaeon]
MEDLEFEDIYTEENLNAEGILYREDESSWSPTEDIDWDLEEDLPEEKNLALSEAATQFHYSNSSHLILCGRLMEQSEDMEIKKLATYLAFSKMRNVDVFGRYLGKNPANAEIAPETKEYLGRMSSEENMTNLLLGMGVLGGTVGYGVLGHLKDAGSPLFSQIAEKVIEQKHGNEDILVNALQNLVDAADDEDMEKMRELARYYRERSEQIVLFHSDLLNRLELDPEEVAESVLEATDRFY